MAPPVVGGSRRAGSCASSLCTQPAHTALCTQPVQAAQHFETRLAQSEGAVPPLFLQRAGVAHPNNRWVPRLGQAQISGATPGPGSDLRCQAWARLTSQTAQVWRPFQTNPPDRQSKSWPSQAWRAPCWYWPLHRGPSVGCARSPLRPAPT